MVNKYRNQKTMVDNITFASKKEAARYQELKLMVKSGDIEDLELQPQFRLSINDMLICRYIADFKYLDLYASKKKGDFAWVVEDVKGMKTAAYRLKKKLMKACLNIDIVEI